MRGWRPPRAHSQCAQSAASPALPHSHPTVAPADAQHIKQLVAMLNLQARQDMLVPRHFTWMHVMQRLRHTIAPEVHDTNETLCSVLYPGQRMHSKPACAWTLCAQRTVASSEPESTCRRSSAKRATCTGRLWPLSWRSSVRLFASNTCRRPCML